MPVKKARKKKGELDWTAKQRSSKLRAGIRQTTGRKTWNKSLDEIGKTSLTDTLDKRFPSNTKKKKAKNK